MQKHSTADYTLSVVIAAKDAPWQLLQLCVSSFAALSNAYRIEIVIVKSGDCPSLERQLTARFVNYQIVDVPAQGIYAAYNAGIQRASGTHVLFFGIDDVALPGMDKVIDELAATGWHYHLFAGACYMQGVGVAQPAQWRASLAFQNWCHQGIFYLRSYLADHPFQAEYPAQADHKMNIDIVSNPSLRFGISRELVAYFSAGGVSSLRPDLRFRGDLASIVSHAYGKHLGALVWLKQRLIDSLLGPPEKRFRTRLRG